MARPRKNILKLIRLSVCCTKTDSVILKRYAHKCRLSVSEYLLKAGLEKRIKTRLTDEEIYLFKQLISLSNNTNQIAKKLNSGGTLNKQAIEDLSKLHELLKKFE